MRLSLSINKSVGRSGALCTHIVRHLNVGYLLTCDVKWFTQTELFNKNYPRKASKSLPFIFSNFMLLCVVILITHSLFPGPLFNVKQFLQPPPPHNELICCGFHNSQFRLVTTASSTWWPVLTPSLPFICLGVCTWKKIPLEMEVAPHYKLLTFFTRSSMFTLFIIFKLLYNALTVACSLYILL